MLCPCASTFPSWLNGPQGTRHAASLSTLFCWLSVQLCAQFTSAMDIIIVINKQLIRVLAGHRQPFECPLASVFTERKSLISNVYNFHAKMMADLVPVFFVPCQQNGLQHCHRMMHILAT